VEEPSQEIKDKLKAQFPDRALRLVELHDDASGEAMWFIMTGPNKAEYKKFTDEVLAARDAKGGDAAKSEALQVACERAALAMIRWPSRDEVKELFESRPGLSSAFPAEIHAAAGANFEVRAKKL
jgi:hypothetical protein